MISQLLQLSRYHPKLKDQIFRYVDLLPLLDDSQDTIDRLTEYLAEADGFLAATTRLAQHIPGFNRVAAVTIKSLVNLVANNFIVGSNIQEALVGIRKLKASGLHYSLDILGELAITEIEAQRYLDQYIALIEEIPETNVSVKLSAIYSKVKPVAFEKSKSELKNRLRQIYRAAIKHGAEVNVDLEHFAWKDLTNAVVAEVLVEDEFKTWDKAGIVLQCYLKSSSEDLAHWIAWAKKRGAPIKIRLVKGAYWDYEKALAEQHTWDCPVYTSKSHTDDNYKTLSKLALDNYMHIKVAIASHNRESVDYALNYAQSQKVPLDRYEFQMLYGMVDDLKTYLQNKGQTVRAYLPYGELIPGMAYLVRRLLENTANESFLAGGSNTSSALLSKETKRRDFVNAPNSDFAQSKARASMYSVLEATKAQLDSQRQYPLTIDGEQVETKDQFLSVNPAQPQQVLGLIAQANIQHVEIATAAADKAFGYWSKLHPEKRISIIREAAQTFRSQRFRFNSILVLEAGKTWEEADAEVSEMIDFIEYYALQARKLFTEQKLISLSGEKNTNAYAALGVAAIISPWNFPLAITGGMTVAALLAGNTVIMKPSMQTGIITYELAKILNDSLKRKLGDNSAGILNYLPGPGSTVGNHLVEHDKTKVVIFTGSSQVGMSINAKINSNPYQVKHLSAETGGKNAVIVDETADLDEAIPGVVYSAFAFAGQKCSACSRLVITGSIYDSVIKRLREAIRTLVIGDPQDPATEVPPVIDEHAHKKVLEYIDLGKSEGKMLIGDLAVPDQGYFVSPTVFTDLPSDSRLITEEIFGPVLVVQRARDIDHAIELVNSSAYGLTGGLYSRSPKNIRKVSEGIEVGNFYINRPCTGAIVGRQAFGGMKLSSIGFKAGGPNYLLQFVKERTITENTMRRGFAVDE